MKNRSPQSVFTPRQTLADTFSVGDKSAGLHQLDQNADVGALAQQSFTDAEILLALHAQNLDLYRHFDTQRAQFGNSLSILVSILSIAYVYFQVIISGEWLALFTSLIIVQFALIWRGSQQKLSLRIEEVYKRARSYENYMQILRPSLPLEEIRNRTRLENKIAENESFWLQNMRRDALWAYLPNLTFAGGVILFIYSFAHLWQD